MLIDTHAHLDYPDFAKDFAEIIARANSAGVTRIITIGTSIESSRRAVELAGKSPDIFAVIGVHPTNATSADEDVTTPLRELARHPRVVAIGETGFDYHHLPGPRLRKMFEQALGFTSAEESGDAETVIHQGAYKSAQASLFEQQLDLAVELGLNVVIHQRDAWRDTVETLRKYTGKTRGVFHCFGNSIAEAEEVIALGHMVSFTGIVTFKNAPLVHETAAKVPENSYMVETDCPYLAPVPFRGQRCEPAHTRQVAEKIAILRGFPVEEVARQTSENAEAFFRFRR
jgi:TatD DNase family protein